MALWTLDEITSAVMNNVTDGLQGSPNTPIPINQVRAEVGLLRNSLVVQSFAADGTACKKMHEYASLEQHIGCITPSPGDTSNCCGVDGDVLLPMATVPEILTVKETPLISFLGGSNKQGFGWKVYYGESHKAKPFLPGSSKRPYGVLYPARNGYHKLFLYNAPVSLQDIAVTAIFADPYAMYEYACCSLSGKGEAEDVAAFAAPDYMIETIIERLSTKYITYYRQMNAPIVPNDQTDKTT